MLEPALTKDGFTVRDAMRRAAVPLMVTVVLASVGSALLAQTGKLDDIALRFSPWWLGPGLGAFTLAQLMLFGTWRLMTRRLGATVPLCAEAAAWNVSLLARFVPTSALMIVVRVRLLESKGVPRRTTLVAIVYETLLQLVAATVIGAWWLIQMPQLEGHAARWAVLGVPVFGLIALHPRVIGVAVSVVLRRLGRGGGTITLPNRTVLVAATLYAVCLMVAGLGVLCTVKAFTSVDSGDVPLVVATYAIGFTVSVLAFMLPGGLGARETGLATALLPAIPFAVGLAVAVVTRLMQLGLEILLAGLTRILDVRTPTSDLSRGITPPERLTQARAEPFAESSPTPTRRKMAQRVS